MADEVTTPELTPEVEEVLEPTPAEPVADEAIEVGVE